VSGEASSYEAELERSAQAHRVVGTALILDEAGELTHGTQVDLAGSAHALLPGTTVNLLARKERPVDVSVPSLPLVIACRGLLDRQISSEVAIRVDREAVYVAATDDIRGLTPHARRGDDVGFVEPREQILAEPPRKDGIQRVIRKVLSSEADDRNPTSIAACHKGTRVAEQRTEVIVGGFKSPPGQRFANCWDFVHSIIIGGSGGRPYGTSRLVPGPLLL
jgi:hypothetical protein